MRKKKINGIEHGLVKWIGYSDKFNEWVPVSKINLILKNNFLHYYIEWYSRSTTTMKNVWQHCVDRRTYTQKRPYTCEFCNVTILKGNKWLHFEVI